MNRQSRPSARPFERWTDEDTISRLELISQPCVAKTIACLDEIDALLDELACLEHIPKRPDPDSILADDSCEAALLFSNQCMEPSHPNWREFVCRLNTALDTESCKCQGNRRIARSIMRNLGMDRGAIQASCDWCEGMGGNCDCEIAMTIWESTDVPSGDEDNVA